jgi:hypothetical protein
MAMSKFLNLPLLCLLLFAKTTSIPFVSKVKKMYKVDGPVADKTEWIKSKFLMDQDNTDSKYSRYYVIFKNRFPKELIKWPSVRLST